MTAPHFVIPSRARNLLSLGAAEKQTRRAESRHRNEEKLGKRRHNNMQLSVVSLICLSVPPTYISFVAAKLPTQASLRNKAKINVEMNLFFADFSPADYRKFYSLLTRISSLHSVAAEHGATDEQEMIGYAGNARGRSCTSTAESWLHWRTFPNGWPTQAWFWLE